MNIHCKPSWVPQLPGMMLGRDAGEQLFPQILEPTESRVFALATPKTVDEREGQGLNWGGGPKC